MEEKEAASVFKCGPSSDKCKCDCPNSCEHIWDGKPYIEKGFGTATCSRCGMRAFDHDMWVLS